MLHALTSSMQPARRRRSRPSSPGALRRTDVVDGDVHAFVAEPHRDGLADPELPPVTIAVLPSSPFMECSSLVRSLRRLGSGQPVTDRSPCRGRAVTNGAGDRQRPVKLLSAFAGRTVRAPPRARVPRRGRADDGLPRRRDVTGGTSAVRGPPRALRRVHRVPRPDARHHRHARSPPSRPSSGCRGR